MVQAQPGEKQMQDVEPLKGETETQFDRLLDGNSTFVEKTHRSVLDKAARWYIGRVTIGSIQERIPDGGGNLSGDTLNDIYQQFDRIIKKADPNNAQVGEKRDAQKKFCKEFSKSVVSVVDEALKNPVMIARINAARMCARMAEVSPEEMADPLLKMLDDPQQIDAVKLWILRSLRTPQARQVQG